MKVCLRLFSASLLILLSSAATSLFAQDWVHTGTNLGAGDRIRIAAADFKAASVDPQTPALKAVFDATLYADLGNAGIFDLVSKSMAPQAAPGSPQEINLPQWSAAPSNAAMVAFGALSTSERPRFRERLALRHAQHDQPAGAREAVQRSRQRRFGAHHRPSLRR